jgi:hypothetical protein
MKLAKTARELVWKHGGPTKFSKKVGCSLRTAQSYSSGTNLPEWQLNMIDFALQHGYEVGK